MSPVSTPKEAYVTLLLNDGYVPGAKLLAWSLKDAKCINHSVALIVDTLSSESVQVLKELYDELIVIPVIDSEFTENLAKLNRLDLKLCFTKLHVFDLLQFNKVVYLDADTMVLQNIDELFEMDTKFAAAPDIGWPDSFNSGVFVTKPNKKIYNDLVDLAKQDVSFDGGDQGLLNIYFPEPDRLGFGYNTTPAKAYQNVPAFRYYEKTVKIVHFLGPIKPWNRERPEGSGIYNELLGRWWDMWVRHTGDDYPEWVKEFTAKSKHIQSQSQSQKSKESNGTNGVNATQKIAEHGLINPVTPQDILAT